MRTTVVLCVLVVIAALFILWRASTEVCGEIFLTEVELQVVGYRNQHGQWPADLSFIEDPSALWFRGAKVEYRPPGSLSPKDEPFLVIRVSGREVKNIFTLGLLGGRFDGLGRELDEPAQLSPTPDDQDGRARQSAPADGGDAASPPRTGASASTFPEIPSLDAALYDNIKKTCGEHWQLRNMKLDTLTVTPSRDEYSVRCEGIVDGEPYRCVIRVDHNGNWINDGRSKKAP